MSLPVTMYYCTQCDFQQGDGGTWGTREYVLGSGVRIPVRWQIGWCESCNGIAPIEDLSSSRRIQEYREAQRTLSHLSQKSSNQWFLGLSKWERESLLRCEDKMQDAIDALEMISIRKSPPHCLNCSSTQVHVPNKAESKVDGKSEEHVWRHIGCGGDIRARLNDDGLRLALRQSVQRYTPEGLFIEKEYVDGYSAPDDEYWDALKESNRRYRSLSLSIQDDEGFVDFPKFLRKYAD